MTPNFPSNDEIFIIGIGILIFLTAIIIYMIYG